MINRYCEQIANDWKKNKGKGFVIAKKPFNYKDLLAKILELTMYKSYTIGLVYENINDLAGIKEVIKKTFIDFDTSKISCINRCYINDNFSYSYDLIFILDCENINTIKKLISTCKFILAIYTVDLKTSKKVNAIINLLPQLNSTITYNDIRNYHARSPVEEEHVRCFLNPEDLEEYNKHSEYITETMIVLGDLDNIKYIQNGDVRTGESAASFRERLAIDNGWSPTLDMSIPFNVKIDQIYNPNTLLEKATNIYEIIRSRKNMIINYESKLNSIKDIVIDNVDKKILIISKRADFATNISNHLIDVNLNCVEYHDEIPKRIARDDNGEKILYKSGEKKGEPKIIGSKAISTMNLGLFLSGNVNILSSKLSSLNGLELECDICIITSPFCGSVNSIKERFKFINFLSTPNKVYKLFCESTIEEKELSKQKDPYSTIVNRKINYIVE